MLERQTSSKANWRLSYNRDFALLERQTSSKANWRRLFSRKSALLGLVGMAVVLAGCAKREAATIDPCSLLDQAEIGAVLGNPVDKGRPSGTGESCQFRPAPDPGKGRTLLLSVVESDSHSGFAIDARNASLAMRHEVTSVQGVGDEAFVSVTDSGVTQSAEARRGDRRVRVLITGEGAGAIRGMDLVSVALKEL